MLAEVEACADMPSFLAPASPATDPLEEQPTASAVARTAEISLRQAPRRDANPILMRSLPSRRVGGSLCRVRLKPHSGSRPLSQVACRQDDERFPLSHLRPRCLLRLRRHHGHRNVLDRVRGPRLRWTGVLPGGAAWPPPAPCPCDETCKRGKRACSAIDRGTPRECRDLEQATAWILVDVKCDPGAQNVVLLQLGLEAAARPGNARAYDSIVRLVFPVPRSGRAGLQTSIGGARHRAPHGLLAGRRRCVTAIFSVVAIEAAVPRGALACGSSGPDGVSACNLAEYQEDQRPRWRVGASGVYTSTVIHFSNTLQTGETRFAGLAEVSYGPTKRLALSLGLGGAIGGRLLAPDGPHDFASGFVSSLGVSYRFVEGATPIGRGFVAASGLLSWTASSTQLGDQGAHTAYNAVDLRAGLAAGLTWGKMLTAYGVVRAFGGPVYWSYQGTSEAEPTRTTTRSAAGSPSSCPDAWTSSSRGYRWASKRSRPARRSRSDGALDAPYGCSACCCSLSSQTRPMDTPSLVFKPLRDDSSGYQSPQVVAWSEIEAQRALEADFFTSSARTGQFLHDDSSGACPGRVRGDDTRRRRHPVMTDGFRQKWRRHAGSVGGLAAKIRRYPEPGRRSDRKLGGYEEPLRRSDRNLALRRNGWWRFGPGKSRPKPPCTDLGTLAAASGSIATRSESSDRAKAGRLGRKPWRRGRSWMREPNSWSLPRRTLPNTEEEASSGAAAALAPIPTKSAKSWRLRRNCETLR